MASKPRPANLDDLVRRYEAGESAAHLAKELGVYTYVVTRWFREADIDLRSGSDRLALAWQTRHRSADDLPAAEILARYRDGASGKVLAEEYRTPRTAINEVLRRAGVPIRDRSSGMRQRWASGSETAERLLGQAWATRRGQVDSGQALAVKALAKSLTLSSVGRYEVDAAMAIARAGCHVVPQMAIGPYNIDIALDVHRIAVEIYTSGLKVSRPGRGGTLKRYQYLLDPGWSILRVNAIRFFDAVGLAEYVVALADATSRNEARWRGYGVIRGNGQIPFAVRPSPRDTAIASPRRTRLTRESLAQSS